MGDIFIDFDTQELNSILDLFDDFEKKDSKKSKKKVSECECGCDKVYGPNNKLHSQWCKKYKKEK